MQRGENNTIQDYLDTSYYPQLLSTKFPNDETLKENQSTLKFIVELQSEINLLAIDNSREAQIEKRRLEEKLVDNNERIDVQSHVKMGVATTYTSLYGCEGCYESEKKEEKVKLNLLQKFKLKLFTKMVNKNYY